MRRELSPEENAELQALIDFVAESELDIDELQDKVAEQFSPSVVNVYNAMFGISPDSN